MKNLVFWGGFVLLLTNCSALRFVGDPLVINSEIKAISLSEEQKRQWHLLDLNKDSIPGTSVLRAYDELIKDKKGERVIIAIIDSGVDIEHPCLEGIIWTNEDEIENNGLDDDQNGYVDDRNGWNFLGNADKENMEYVRQMKTTAAETEAYRIYADFLQKEKTKVLAELPQINAMLQRINASDSLLSASLNTTDYTLDQARALSPKSPALMDAIRMKEFMENAGFDQSDVAEYSDYLQNRLDHHFNIAFEGRTLVGDNPNDFSNKNYGNAQVIGPDLDSAQHGTHVAGIIGANCSHPNHPQGVAQNIDLMVVRAIPDGDEYDKDVALAIRYAVDNGAQVINTSFGKDFSPHPEWVYEALRYAASKDVLIVNAAGNDSKNIDPDQSPSFPRDHIDGKEFVDNFITVGGTTSAYDTSQVAPFSNYGAVSVDVFAPGANIYSTTPDNTHSFLNGTSMAAPSVAGIAAVLRSFFPKLSAPTIKKIILDSSIPLFASVIHPETETEVTPQSLSKTGNLANLYNALLLASKAK